MSEGKYQLVVEEIEIPPKFWEPHPDDGPLPEGDDALLSLIQASRLPILGNQFDERALWRAADTERLRTTRPMGGGKHYTTRQWVRDWIQGTWQPHSPQGFNTTKTEPLGQSSTKGSAPASASLAARLTKLKGG